MNDITVVSGFVEARGKQVFFFLSQVMVTLHQEGLWLLPLDQSSNFSSPSLAWLKLAWEEAKELSRSSLFRGAKWMAFMAPGLAFCL